jgi:hypothetical protein
MTSTCRLPPGTASRIVLAASRPAQRPVRTAAEPAGTTRLASEDAIGQRIESLHADSAQLEQLLAMVRDERVANATTVALSSEFDDTHRRHRQTRSPKPGLDAVHARPASGSSASTRCGNWSASKPPTASCPHAANASTPPWSASTDRVLPPDPPTRSA